MQFFVLIINILFHYFNLKSTIISCFGGDIDLFLGISLSFSKLFYISLFYNFNLSSSIISCISSGDTHLSLGISLSCSFVTVSTIFCCEVFETFVILLAILSPIKSPVVSAVFERPFLKKFYLHLLQIVKHNQEVFDHIYGVRFYLYFYERFYPYFYILHFYILYFTFHTFILYTLINNLSDVYFTSVSSNSEF